MAPDPSVEAEVASAVICLKLEVITRLDVSLDVVEQPLRLALIDPVPTPHGEDDLALLVASGVLEGGKQDRDVHLVLVRPFGLDRPVRLFALVVRPLDLVRPRFGNTCEAEMDGYSSCRQRDR